MIRVARTAIAAEGKHVTIELTLDSNGVTINKTDEQDVVQEMGNYTLDEAETIYELMQMLRPQYKTGS